MNITRQTSVQYKCEIKKHERVKRTKGDKKKERKERKHTRRKPNNQRNTALPLTPHPPRAHPQERNLFEAEGHSLRQRVSAEASRAFLQRKDAESLKTELSCVASPLCYTRFLSLLPLITFQLPNYSYFFQPLYCRFFFSSL